MPEANLIKEHMEVVGSDGTHVGMIDSVADEEIKLTKLDSADQQHHYVPTSLVQDIKGNVITLTQTADEVVWAQFRVGSGDLPSDPQIGVASSDNP